MSAHFWRFKTASASWHIDLAKVCAVNVQEMEKQVHKVVIYFGGQTAELTSERGAPEFLAAFDEYVKSLGTPA